MLTWFAREETPVLMGPRVTLRAPRPGDYMAWRNLRRDSRDFLKPYEPRWSEADRRNVEAFQRAQGWRGGAADGLPGPETWRRLFA